MSSQDELRRVNEKKIRALDLSHIRERYHGRRLSAEELARIKTEWQEEHSNLAAFIQIVPREAIEAQTKAIDEEYNTHPEDAPPLVGVTAVVSDSVETAGIATSYGLSFLDEWTLAADAPVVERLKTAGMVLAGKTNVTQLGLSHLGANPNFGNARNPYDFARAAGGAAGGAAAAVAARFCQFAVVSDTSGDARIPAALCGAVGFKPTYARYPRQGIFPLAPTKDSMGLMARTVGDMQFLDNIVMAEDPLNPPLDKLITMSPPSSVKLLLIKEHFWDNMQGAAKVQIDKAFGKIRDAGVEIVEVDMPVLEGLDDSVPALVARVSRAIVGFEAPREIGIYFSRRGTGTTAADLLGAVTAPERHLLESNVMGTDDFIDNDEYRYAMTELRPRLQALLRGLLEEHGAHGIVYPTVPLLAPMENTTSVCLEGEEEEVEVDPILKQNVDVASTLGFPALSLPAGVTKGDVRLPTALEIMGPMDSDETLLQVGRALEDIVGPMPGPRLG